MLLNQIESLLMYAFTLSQFKSVHTDAMADLFGLQQTIFWSVFLTPCFIVVSIFDPMFHSM